MTKIFRLWLFVTKNIILINSIPYSASQLTYQRSYRYFDMLKIKSSKIFLQNISNTTLFSPSKFFQLDFSIYDFISLLLSRTFKNWILASLCKTLFIKCPVKRRHGIWRITLYLHPLGLSSQTHCPMMIVVN